MINLFYLFLFVLYKQNRSSCDALLLKCGFKYAYMYQIEQSRVSSTSWIIDNCSIDFLIQINYIFMVLGEGEQTETDRDDSLCDLSLSFTSLQERQYYIE